MTVFGGSWATLFFVLLSFMPTLLFAYLGQFSRPWVDEYARIGLASDMGIWEMMLYWREVWNGDYTNFLFIGLMAPLGAAVSSVFPLVIITLASAAYGWLTSALLRDVNILEHRWKTIAALTSLMVAATINGFHSPESFYWLSAAMEYTLPMILYLLGIAIAVEIAPRLRGNVQHLLAAAITAFLSFMNAGFGEMYLVIQLPMVALTTVFVYLSRRSAQRRSFLILALAAGLGTFASLIVQLSSPGIAYRSSLPDFYGYILTPARELPLFLSRTFDAVMNVLAHDESFSGFMLVACAGMFFTLTAASPLPRADAKLRKITADRSPIALGLIIQLLFVPLLWSHQSDNLQVLGRFSVAYFSVVSINLVAIVVMLALLWRRRQLERWFNKRNGLMVYCCCVLLAVCLMFIMTQVRSIHHKAFFFLFVSVVTALYILASQMKTVAADPRLNRLLRLSVSVSASTAIVLAWLVAVVSFTFGISFEVFDRIFAWMAFMVMTSGLMWGVTLGAMIQRGYRQMNASAAWLKWIKLLSLLVALAIGVRIIIGQSGEPSRLRMNAEAWDTMHAEIIRLRNAGDLSVYSKSFKKIFGVWTASPVRYEPLAWYELAFYDLDYPLPDNPYGPKDRASR